MHSKHAYKSNELSIRHESELDRFEILILKNYQLFSKFRTKVSKKKLKNEKF